MGNTDIFHPQTATGRFLLWMWDMIDISENMGRIEDWTMTISNGGSALVHLGVFLFLSAAAGALTWFFDIESTIQGMSGITNVVIPSLPGQIAHLSWYVILALTLMPTFLEIFTAGMAKYNIKIIQLSIIAFTLFDMITDIPRAYQRALEMWPQIEVMGWGLSHIVYWTYFIFWLFFSTLGFEVGFVVFLYASWIFFWKTIRGEGSYNVASNRMRTPAYRQQSSRRPTAARQARRSPPVEAVVDDNVIDITGGTVGDPEVIIVD